MPRSLRQIAWMGPATVLSGVAALTATPASLAGRWAREPSMPTARAAHAVVATAEAIYVLAGTGSDGAPIAHVERFDGRAWARDTSLPGEGLNAPAAAVLGDDIYLIGGFVTTTNRPVAAVHRYNMRTRRWSEAAPLPSPRGGHAAVVLDEHIHVVGGGNDRSTIDSHDVYDPKRNAWSERAPLPRSVGSPAAVVYQGRLYSIGGRSGPNDFGDVYVYDATANSWAPGIAIPARGTGGAAVVGDSIYYFGGESQASQTVLDGVLRLDPGASNWVPDTPMPTGRNFARAVTFRNRIFVVGGSTVYGRSHAAMGAGVVESFRR